MKDNLTNRIGFNQIQDLHRFLLEFSLKKNLFIEREALYSHNVSAVDLKELLVPVLAYLDEKESDAGNKKKFWKVITQLFRNKLMHFRFSNDSLENHRWMKIQQSIYDFCMVCNKYADISPVACYLFEIDNIIDSRKTWNRYLPYSLSWLSSEHSISILSFSNVSMHEAIGNLLGAMTIFHTVEELSSVNVVTTSNFEAKYKSFRDRTKTGFPNTIQYLWIIIDREDDINAWIERNPSVLHMKKVLIITQQNNTSYNELHVESSGIPDGLSEEEQEFLWLLDFAKQDTSIEVLSKGYNLDFMRMYPTEIEKIKDFFPKTTLNTFFCELETLSNDITEKEMIFSRGVAKRAVSFIKNEYLIRGRQPSHDVKKFWISFVKKYSEHERLYELVVLLTLLSENTEDRYTDIRNLVEVSHNFESSAYTNLLLFSEKVDRRDFLPKSHSDDINYTELSVEIRDFKEANHEKNPIIANYATLLLLQLEYTSCKDLDQLFTLVPKFSDEIIKTCDRMYDYTYVLLLLHTIKWLSYGLTLPQPEDYIGIRENRNQETIHYEEHVQKCINEISKLISFKPNSVLLNILSRLETHLVYIGLKRRFFEAKSESTSRKDIILQCTNAIRNKIIFHQHHQVEKSKAQVYLKILEPIWIFLSCMKKLSKPERKDLFNEDKEKDSSYIKNLRAYTNRLLWVSFTLIKFPCVDDIIKYNLEQETEDFCRYQFQETYSKLLSQLSEYQEESQLISFEKSLMILWRVLRFTTLIDSLDDSSTEVPNSIKNFGLIVKPILLYGFGLSKKETDKRFVQYILENQYDLT